MFPLKTTRHIFSGHHPGEMGWHLAALAAPRVTRGLRGPRDGTGISKKWLVSMGKPIKIMDDLWMI